jgi:hypothetical protein
LLTRVSAHFDWPKVTSVGRSTTVAVGAVVLVTGARAPHHHQGGHWAFYLGVHTIL